MIATFGIPCLRSESMNLPLKGVSRIFRIYCRFDFSNLKLDLLEPHFDCNWQDIHQYADELQIRKQMPHRPRVLRKSIYRDMIWGLCISKSPIVLWYTFSTLRNLNYMGSFVMFIDYFWRFLNCTSIIERCHRRTLAGTGPFRPRRAGWFAFKMVLCSKLRRAITYRKGSRENHNRWRFDSWVPAQVSELWPSLPGFWNLRPSFAD